MSNYPSTPTPRRSQLRVLIADDTPEVRRELRMLLTLAGDIEIVGEAANGLEAIRLSDLLQPDALITDLEMPLMDGYEAVRQIKERQPSCRIVVLTIHNGEAEREKAKQAGADVFLVKGEAMEVLLKALFGAEM
jgi:DNA-binding NarL/FixJ family response regulator